MRASRHSPTAAATCPALRQVRSRNLTFKWGHDGGDASQCWEVRMRLAASSQQQQQAWKNHHHHHHCTCTAPPRSTLPLPIITRMLL